MKKSFRLVGLDCANCANKMERKINKIDGVREAVVNFMTTKLVIEYDDTKEASILEEVERAVHSIDSSVVIKRA